MTRGPETCDVDGQLLQLLAIVVLVGVSGLCSGSEIALVSLRPTQIDRMAGGDRRDRAVAQLARDPNRFLATLQIGTTLAGFLASAIGAVSLAEPLVGVFAPMGGFAQPTAILLVTAALTYVTLVLGELAPKRIAMHRAQGWSRAVAATLDRGSRLVRPVIWLLSHSVDIVVRAVGIDPRRARAQHGELELRELITAPGIVPDSHQQVLMGAMEVRTRTLREMMVPRVEVVAVAEDRTVDEALHLLLERGFSRAPVYREDLDDADRTVSVVGLVNAGAAGPAPGGDARGLAGSADSGQADPARVADHAVEATILPESLPVLDALRQLQAAHRRLAIVLSEHGGVEGIVTVEDLVEEIVGEIRDEHDTDHLDVRRYPDGRLRLPGRFPLTDLEDVEVAFDHAAVEATSLGGLFAESLGRLPRRGDSIEVQGHRLTAVTVRRRAVTEVEIASAEDRDEPDGG